MKILKFFHTLFFHRRIIASLESELMKPLELRVQELNAKLGGIDVKVESPIITMFSNALIELFRSVDGANNYLTLTFVDQKTSELFEVMIQRRDGKTPSQIVEDQKEKMILFDIMVATLNDIADNKGQFNQGLEEFLTHNNLRK